MRLCDALRVSHGDIVSLVGAGGKTTTMYRLSRELCDTGWRVVATTTTMIYPPSREHSPALIIEPVPELALNRVEQALRAGGVVTLAAGQLEFQGKLLGIDPDLLPALGKLADVVIAEADGARGKSLKAPAAHEPVVPGATTILVPLAGIDAVGHALGEETAHRPELVAALTGHARGDIITPSLIASLLVHPDGALKGAPPAARVIPLLNKVEDAQSLASGREIADCLCSDLRIDRVLLGAVQAEDPVVECWRRVSAIVLAAGSATRFGSPKQLLPVAGTTLIEHVLHTLQASGVFEIIVVLGYAAKRIAPHIPSWCQVAYNQSWTEGISSSIRSGLRAVSPAAQATLLVLADQPRIRSEDINRILQAYYGTTRSIVVPFHHGQRGTPALFDRRHFAGLASLSGDVGGRQLIAALPHEVLAVELPSAGPFLDIDTPTDYEQLLKHSDETGADV
jgi:molybdenum cofactor cytidylyltransferase